MAIGRVTNGGNKWINVLETGGANPTQPTGFKDEYIFIGKKEPITTNGKKIDEAGSGFFAAIALFIGIKRALNWGTGGGFFGNLFFKHILVNAFTDERVMNEIRRLANGNDVLAADLSRRFLLRFVAGDGKKGRDSRNIFLETSSIKNMAGIDAIWAMRLFLIHASKNSESETAKVVNDLLYQIRKEDIDSTTKGGEIEYAVLERLKTIAEKDDAAGGETRRLFEEFGLEDTHLGKTARKYLAEIAKGNDNAGKDARLLLKNIAVNSRNDVAYEAANYLADLAYEIAKSGSTDDPRWSDIISRLRDIGRLDTKAGDCIIWALRGIIIDSDEHMTFGLSVRLALVEIGKEDTPAGDKARHQLYMLAVKFNIVEGALGGLREIAELNNKAGKEARDYLKDIAENKDVSDEMAESAILKLNSDKDDAAGEDSRRLLGKLGKRNDRRGKLARDLLMTLATRATEGEVGARAFAYIGIIGFTDDEAGRHARQFLKTEFLDSSPLTQENAQPLQNLMMIARNGSAAAQTDVIDAFMLMLKTSSVFPSTEKICDFLNGLAREIIDPNSAKYYAECLWPIENSKRGELLDYNDVKSLVMKIGILNNNVGKEMRLKINEAAETGDDKALGYLEEIGKFEGLAGYETRQLLKETALKNGGEAGKNAVRTLAEIADGKGEAAIHSIKLLGEIGVFDNETWRLALDALSCESGGTVIQEIPKELVVERIFALANAALEIKDSHKKASAILKFTPFIQIEGFTGVLAEHLFTLITATLSDKSNSVNFEAPTLQEKRINKMTFLLFNYADMDEISKELEKTNLIQALLGGKVEEVSPQKIVTELKDKANIFETQNFQERLEKLIKITNRIRNIADRVEKSANKP